MGGECSAHGSDEKTYKILVEKPERETHPEDVGVDGKTILKCTSGK
jgi:hypothetical protein